MLPIIAAAVAGGWVGKEVYALTYPLLTKTYKSAPMVKKSLPIAGIPDIRLLSDLITEEQPMVLATEDIPLDNRFGNKVLLSEHEFIRTATITFSMMHDNISTAGVNGGFLTMVEGLAQKEIKKRFNIELNTHVTRRVKVTFATEPGYLVRYRVIWQQNSRRGIFAVSVKGQVYNVPYLLIFGLSHAIESIAGESISLPLPLKFSD